MARHESIRIEYTNGYGYADSMEMPINTTKDRRAARKMMAYHDNDACLVIVGTSANDVGVTTSRVFRA